MSKKPKKKEKIKQVSFDIKSEDDIKKPTPSLLPSESIQKTKSEMSGKDAIKIKEKKKLEKKEKELKLKKKMKEIGRTHPEFELSYDLLLGIRTSTSLVNKSIIIKSSDKDIYGNGNDSSDEDEELLEKEFIDNKRYSFPSSGSSITPSHAMNDFEFKDYCRPIFAQLRM